MHNTESFHEIFEMSSDHFVETILHNKVQFPAVVDPRKDWTPHRLELCLWAMAVAQQQQLPLFKDVDVKAGRAAEKSPDADSSPRAAKKLKTK